MKNSNVNSVFEGILSALDPTKPVENVKSVLDVAEIATKNNTVFLSGFNKISVVFTSNGLPTEKLEAIREIILDTLSKVSAL